MIQATNIKKIYTTDEVETTALDSVNLNVKEGEFVSVMGPSGCGKSTLLNILGLLDNPTEGTYQFAGEEVSGSSEKERADLRKGNIGFVFQSFNLIDELTVYENIELPLLYLKTPSRERKERIDAVADRLKIAHRLKHFPQQLSGGQQQRVAIARALSMSPSIILADEPTGNIATKQAIEIMKVLEDLNDQGHTIVMITHEKEIAQYAKRIINLRDGKIVQDKENGYRRLINHQK